MGGGGVRDKCVGGQEGVGFGTTYCKNVGLLTLMLYHIMLAVIFCKLGHIIWGGYHLWDKIFAHAIAIHHRNFIYIDKISSQTSCRIYPSTFTKYEASTQVPTINEYTLQCDFGCTCLWHG